MRLPLVYVLASTLPFIFFLVWVAGEFEGAG